MQRKTRLVIANSAIAVASLAGGALIANSLTADIGGIASIFGATPAGNTVSGSTDQTAVDKTVTGDPIQYRYGTVQVEVVRTGGKITAINLPQADATAGREQAYPMLQQAALDAQGTNFGNISGATYTVDAFKQALASAITKLG